VDLPIDEVHRRLEDAGARAEAFSANDLQSFVSARCAALEGAQVLIIRGPVSDEGFARARAAENRVFVWAGSASTQFIIQPDGSFIYRQGERVRQVELDLAQADLKQFTPETDIWAQRRAECYRLPTSSPVLSSS
jgi:hypothetical protein